MRAKNCNIYWNWGADQILVKDPQAWVDEYRDGCAGDMPGMEHSGVPLL